jgi:hypothetical protein
MTTTKFKVGDRVHYMVLGEPCMDTIGTVVRVQTDVLDGPLPGPVYFYVQWDGVDYDHYAPAAHHADDLTKVAEELA